MDCSKFSGNIHLFVLSEDLLRGWLSLKECKEIAQSLDQLQSPHIPLRFI